MREETDMRKRLLAGFLAVAMMLTMAPFAFAADNTEETDSSNVVAKIGDAGYATLQEAVNAAQDGQTVTLTQNAGGGVYFGYDKKNNLNWNGTKSITVDFAGYTYDAAPTIGSTGTETNGFQMLKGNTVTLKNGTINSTQAKILIQNYCNLTLEDMNLIGNGDTVLSLN